jgi:hypothetical protein
MIMIMIMVGVRFRRREQADMVNKGRRGARAALWVVPLLWGTPPVLADGPGAAVLRSETQAVGRAIENQVQSDFHGPSAAGSTSAPGPTLWVAAGGAALYAGPNPDSPVLELLPPDSPVSVTGPARGGGWLAVLAAGRRGYVAADRVAPGR